MGMRHMSNRGHCHVISPFSRTLTRSKRRINRPSRCLFFAVGPGGGKITFSDCGAKCLARRKSSVLKFDSLSCLKMSSISSGCSPADRGVALGICCCKSNLVKRGRSILAIPSSFGLVLRSR